MRTSLKKCRMMTIDKVESNEELLIAILVRLPPISIFRFKCVSKRWYNILIDPYFHECYSVRIRNDKLCGNGVGRLLAFVQSGDKSSFSRGRDQLMRLLPVSQRNRHKNKLVPFRNTSLVHCAEGLILCQGDRSEYLVVNPMNRTYVQLPRSYFDGLHSLGLVCEESKVELVPSFRVVGVVRKCDNLEPNSICIETYSSKTGDWMTAKLVATGEVNVVNLKNPYVYDGVFHWHVSGRHSLAIYDSNVDEKHLQLIKLPPDPVSHFAVTRSSKDDALWVGISNPVRITFWMLPKNENRSYRRKHTITEDEWILMHPIDNDSLSSKVEGKKQKKSLCDYSSILKLRALIPSNPIVAVLTLGQKVFLYNLETKSSELVRYHGRPLGETVVSGWHPFMESLYLSTYSPLAYVYE